jgi:hypothetical protein
MASISKLAVVLSAVTKPLEDGLKAADKKVSSFGHSFKEGMSIGLGVLGIDKLEGAMKKALKEDEALGEASEKVELAFGRTLISLTMMSQWLPRLAQDASGFADRMEEGFVFQEVKEKLLWAFEFSKRLNSENADAAAKASRDEFIKHKLIETALERQKKLAREKFEAEREAAWVSMAGTEEQKKLLDELDNKYESLLTDAEKLARVKDAAPNSAKVGLIDYRMGQIAELEKRKKNEEDLKKVMEDGKSLTESMLTPLEKLATEQAKYNDMLQKGAINTDTYNRAVKAITPGLKELESIQKEIYALEKGELAGKLKDLADAGATKDIQDQYKKAFNRLDALKKLEELKKEMEKDFDQGFGDDEGKREGPKFAGAVEAGSAAAYTALIRAQASQQDNSLLTTTKKQLEVDINAFRVLQEMHKQQGDAIKAAGPGIKLVRMNIGGGNN